MSKQWKERYKLGQSCFVVIDGQKFGAVVISTDPPKARITDSDKVWHGCVLDGTYMRASDVRKMC